MKEKIHKSSSHAKSKKQLHILKNGNPPGYDSVVEWILYENITPQSISTQFTVPCGQIFEAMSEGFVA